jgi:hypothetical protein
VRGWVGGGGWVGGWVGVLHSSYIIVFFGVFLIDVLTTVTSIELDCQSYRRN